MQNTILYIASSAAALALTATLAACYHGDTARGLITATPAPVSLTTDSLGQATADLTIHIPARAFSRRARLILTPHLDIDGQTVQEFQPIVADRTIFDKKTRRRVRLDNYEDPYAAIATTIGDTAAALPCRLEARVPEARDGAQRQGRITAEVTTDGCGSCTGLDTLLLADITRPATPKPEPIVERKPTTRLVRRELISKGGGAALLQFNINKYDILPDKGHNRRELERMADTLRRVFADTTYILRGIEINGLASADGSVEFNTQLALNRARAARDWLIRRLGLSRQQQLLFSVTSRPEGWLPVVEAMERAKHKDAAKVRAVVEAHLNESDDVAERIIRRMPCWQDIKTRFLDADRRVNYTYSYSVKGHTEEIEEVYDEPADGKEATR